MPDIKALVINVKPRSQQQGAAGQWQDLTSSIQAFTRDIETPSIQDGVDVSAIVSGVPTVFARADLFNHALNEIQTIRKDASVGLNQYYVNLVDEWRGLIACIALNNTAIEIRRITLAYSDGKDMKTTENMYEPKGAFGNMLMNDRSLWTEQGKAKNAQVQPFLYLIKYNKQVVGATSPRSLFFTSVSYGIDKNAAFVDPATHRFTDPLHSTISDEQLLNLFAYVDKLLPRIKQLEDYYKQTGLTYEGIKGELGTWRNEILKLIRDRKLDENNASALPVQGFGLPFSFLNYTEELYGYNGDITTEPDADGIAKAFKPEELLLPKDSKLLRVWLPREYEKGEKDIATLPIFLLRAHRTGSTDYAFFAIPLSQKGLVVFGRNVSSLLGYTQAGVSINSHMDAEFDEDKSNLSVRLTISVTDENGDRKEKTIPIEYKINGIFKRNKDVVLWPNFISDKWNRYFLYSEMPHNARQEDCQYSAIPFVGNEKQENEIITDYDGNIQYLADKGVALGDAKLLVTSDNRTATRKYKYEIFESKHPFRGVRFTHITGCDSGFILIHYSSTLNANDSLPKDMLDVNRTLSDVTVGVDFGSTNTSVAYHDGQMQYAEGIQFTGQRVSLFTDLGANANQAPAERNVLFFQNEDLYSNAIKSILAIHDDQRLPKNELDGINTLRSEAVQGGFPCFCRHLPVDNVADDTMTLGFRGGQNIVQLIHNMKWSDREEDKAHKQAFLASLLLHIYAELFVKGFVPNVLRWSYPSAMGYNLMLQYNQIWQSLEHVSPVVDAMGNTVSLSVSSVPGLNIEMGESGFGVSEKASSSIPDDGFGDDSPFGGGDPFGGDPFGSEDVFSSSQAEMNSFSNTASAFDDSDNPFGSSSAKQTKIEQKPLVPHREPFKFEFKDIDTSKAMTEACAVANYLSYNINSTNELTFCFDVGGSTTDISVICKDNVASKMLKQNSIRFAAQRISAATKSMESQFEKALTNVCHRNNLKLLGFNDGQKLYSAATAPYYFEQVVDQLDTKQLTEFYQILSTECRPLFCVDMYVTGLITYYAGQLAIKLIKEARQSDELSMFKENWRPKVKIIFAGKGSRIFEWLYTINKNVAQKYYMEMFCMGMGGVETVTANLGGWPNIDIQTKQANEVKFEVSKGLAKTIASPLQISDKVIEIVGENGFTLYNSSTGKEEELNFDDSMSSDFMESIGVCFKSPETLDKNKMCFYNFAGIFYKYVKSLFGKDMVDLSKMMNGIMSMANINTYIQNLPEMQKARRQDKFDYVAPIIILEGMKFYDEFLMNIFKS